MVAISFRFRFRLRLNDMASVFFVWSAPYNNCAMETERKLFIDHPGFLLGGVGRGGICKLFAPPPLVISKSQFYLQNNINTSSQRAILPPDCNLRGFMKPKNFWGMPQTPLNGALVHTIHRPPPPDVL